MQDRGMQKWAAQLRSCRYWTQDQARDVLEKQRASGEGITVFARRMGFVPQRLFWWQGRLRLPSQLPESVAQSFVPVVVRADASDRHGRISVELGGTLQQTLGVPRPTPIPSTIAAPAPSSPPDASQADHDD